MTARVLDGKAIAKQIRGELADQVATFTQQYSVVPRLAAVLVGDDPASEVYVRSKRRACEKLGMESELHRLPADTAEDQLLSLISQLNVDEKVSGILVQMPLPKQISEQRILDSVAPHKDVDCFHPENVGLLFQGRPRFMPCTPHGVQQCLHRCDVDISGKHVVVIGRSEIVGKPLAILLAQRSSPFGPTAANATVTLCHSRTNDLPAITKTADILVAAIGKPKFVTADMIKPDAVVVDVGVNRTDEGLVGDVDFEAALEVASAITPVPGGIGPLTIAMVLKNTLTAAEQQASA